MVILRVVNSEFNDLSTKQIRQTYNYKLSIKSLQPSKHSQQMRMASIIY